MAATQETYTSVYNVSEEWDYEWNPRDQMTRAIKYENGSSNNAGSVSYEYCLSCGGALSKRYEYGAGTGSAAGTLLSGLRYEYDGLNLLRVDEIYGASLSESGPWRIVEVSTHRPGLFVEEISNPVQNKEIGIDP